MTDASHTDALQDRIQQALGEGCVLERELGAEGCPASSLPVTGRSTVGWW